MNPTGIRPALLAAAAIAIALGCCGLASGQATPPAGWRANDLSRPRPPEVAPPAQALPAAAPADAVVLFDGRDLSKWELVRGGAPDWRVEKGYVEVVNGPGAIDPARPGTGAIRTKEKFGDVQIHLEWASPNPPRGVAQDRGNSGVYLMGRYELQVLDSYRRADTYADGQAGAIYGQLPPLANPTRPPGEWQAYDIVFRAPRFGEGGVVVEPPRLTVLLNGIVVQNNEMLRDRGGPQNPAGIGQGPLQLQEHNHPVRYRNVWVRPLPVRADPPSDYGSPAPAARP
jgi:hypothetical protein